MTLLVLLVGVGVAIAGVAWLATRLWLRGEDMSRYDRPEPSGASPPAAPSAEHFDAVARVRSMQAEGDAAPSRRARVERMRAVMDSMSDGLDLGVELVPTDAAGVPAEWVLAPGADPDRRLLYIHGGAFMLGSPRSHRAITAKLSKIAGASVLAIDYRLMPEHRRLDCLTDCQTAYRFVLEHGPRGRAPAGTLFVAGDSAGGNLTLAVIAWARDEGLRAVEGAVALSPHTDSTLAGPSLQRNLDTDPMLGPMFRTFGWVPRGALLWFAWWMNRVPPADPRVSPLRGDLSRLPPVLVHASEAEVLLDDGRRYVARAQAAGSPARLETWPHQVHVWHIFEPTLPEARAAFDAIGSFLESCAPRRAPATASGDVA